MLTLAAWRRLHRWTSLACTLFLLLACLTGLPLIFHEEIDAARTGMSPVSSRPSSPSLSVDQIIERATRAERGQYVQFVFWDGDAADLIGLGMAATSNAPLSEVHRLMFDRVTGELVERRAGESQMLSFLLELHSSLLAGEIGALILGAVALCFVVSVISGVVVYGPTMRRLDFGNIRVNRSSRLRWLDLHNLVGIAAAMWLLVVGATGFINTLEGRLFGAWQGEQMERLLTPFRGKPLPSTLSSPQAAIDTARRALPGMTPTSEGFPYSRFGSPRHYLIWMHGESPVTAHLFTPVMVDAESGVLAEARGLPWYLRVLELSRPLHFGDYGRLPLKILWAALDLLAIAILLTGVRLWWWAAGEPRPARTLGLPAVQ